MIPIDLLIQYNAQKTEYSKGSIIFEQSQRADYYYQILEGKVAMATLNEDGKEFTQGIFDTGKSFGEPVLFIEKLYPSTAKAIENTVVYRLYKDAFFELIETYPKYLLEITKKLSELIYFKSKMGTEISLYDPEHRILTLLKHIKTQEEPQKIDLTRQQIANLTALRVETVIRTIKSLEEKGLLLIKNRKVYF